MDKLKPLEVNGIERFLCYWNYIQNCTFIRLKSTFPQKKVEIY